MHYSLEWGFWENATVEPDVSQGFCFVLQSVTLSS